MKKKRSQVVAGHVTKILSIAIVAVLAINLLAPDKQTSLEENRNLQTFPAFSMTDLVQGKYTKDISEWFSDQFVARNTFIHGKYLLQKLEGTKKIDDVYLAHDQLLEDLASVNEEQLQRNLDAINSFCVNHSANTYFMLVPNAANIQEDRLPANASLLDQNAQMDDIYQRLDSKIQNIDLRSSFKEKKDESLYYSSDHHWTSLGCYYAFNQYLETIGETATTNEDYQIYTVSNSFEGTLAKKVGSIGIEDTIEVYVPKNNPDYLVTNETTQKKSRSLYNSSAIDSQNQYDVFLSGNAGQIQIETNAQSERHLLLIKDSYANAFIPFLLPYYRTITVVDPRYYYDDIDRLYQLNIITDVLFLYNTNTFVQDTSIADVLSVE